MTESCPLCTSPDIQERQRIRYATITDLYRRRYGIEIQPSCASSLAYLECRSCGLLYFHPTVVGDAKLYEDLQGFAWYYAQDKFEFHAMAPFIKPGDTVIEVGGGEGNFARHLPQGATYIGIEFNGEAVTKARAKGLDVSRMSLQEFRRERAVKADVACTFQVLEHVPDPRQFIAQMLGLLKPGGVLALSVPSEDSFVGYEMNNILNAPPHHQTRWTDATLENIGGLFGLRLLRLEHERPAEEQVPSFAKAEFLRLLHQRLGLKVPMFSELGDSFLMKKGIAVLSLPLRRVARRRSPAARGHTVTAVFRSA
jgi:2-polyprenyl-3-methyl-5-hydroxy-6-metoxy-1,4-benzoquinol methylase